MNGEDVGGGMAILDALQEERDNILYMRENGWRRLIGCYVITCKGISSGKRVYYQDRTISRGGYWTQFIGNAYAFGTKNGAEAYASRFKYNSPRVAIVTKSGKLEYT